MIRILTSRVLSLLLFAGLLGSVALPSSAPAQQMHSEDAKHETHAENEMQHREGQHKANHAEHSSSKTHREAATNSGSSLHHATMQALILPALADTLGLSTDQKRRLEKLRSSLLSEQKSRREKLHDQKKELHQLFQESDIPDLEAVRPEIKFLSSTREQLKLAPYGTAIDMREVLNEEQKTHLRELSRQDRHHAVMANMTMKEHMRIKQAVAGGKHNGHRGSGDRQSHMSDCSIHDNSEHGGDHGQHHGEAGE